jgi:membrane associated rhomboid family serine protease
MSRDEKSEAHQRTAPQPERQPIFNLHPAVAATAGLFLAIHAAQSVVLNDSSRNELLVWLAFIPYRLVDIAGSPGGIWPLLWTPFTHAFLHEGWEHVILNTVWFAIFATPLALRYGGARMVALFLGGALAGAAVFAATTLPQFSILLGASGGVAALTGAAIRFMFQPVQVGIDPATGERVLLGRRLASIGEVFRHPTARIFTIVWIVLNGIVPLLPLLMPDMQVAVAWQAHLGGFAFGFLIVPLFERKPHE